MRFGPRSAFQRMTAWPVILITGLIISVATVSAESLDKLSERFTAASATHLTDDTAPGHRKLSETFREFAEDAEPLESAQALFFAATLEGQLYQQLGDYGAAIRAIKTVSSLVEEYPSSHLADDALLLKGDLYLLLGNHEAARSQFTRIIIDYEDGDRQVEAQDRLVVLEETSYLEQDSTLAEVVAKEMKKPALPVVVIDPGHGGHDDGAVGLKGLVEKDVVLDIALRLKGLLQEKGTAEAVLTREHDVFVPLAERTRIANERKATLFVSLHINASPKGKISGYETFYLDNTDDAASRLLAERENSSLALEGGAVDDISFIVSDLIQTGKLRESIILAHHVHSGVLAESQEFGIKIRDLGVRKAPFFVLVGAHMPCILVELLFIDNPRDSKLLIESDYRDALANGLYRGLAEFLTEH